MAYEFAVLAESPEDAEDVRRKVHRHRRTERRPCLSTQPRPSMEPTGGAVWWKEHESTDVTYGRVFNKRPEGTLVQSGAGTVLVKPTMGSVFQGYSREQVVALSFFFWYKGLSTAQQENIRKELEKRGQELPYGL